VPFPIHERKLRAQLDVRAKPYFVRVVDGVHLGYRKGKSVSRWVVRHSVAGGYRTRTFDRIEPDDRAPADGIHFLSFQQMVGKLMNEAPTNAAKALLKCSFCGKPHTAVAKLVAGPGVYICDACVGLCQIYLDHPNERGRLVVDDGKAVLKDGRPVFAPLTPAEQQHMRDLLG